jgi:GntR family transcriptional repressor for pyruvate dehydrogenase complex
VAFAKPSDIAAILRAFEMRLPLEGAASRLAAERRTPDDIATLQQHQRTLRAELDSGGMSAATDMAFHRAVAAATRNEFFLDVMDAIGSVVLGQMDLALSLTRERGAARAETVFAEHERILRAVIEGDGEGAEIAMRYHIDQARKRLTDRTRER